jgi:hypothetical protein
VASAMPSLPFFTAPLPFLRSTVQTVGLGSLNKYSHVPLLLKNFEVVDVTNFLNQISSLLLEKWREVFKQLIDLHDVIK